MKSSRASCAIYEECRCKPVTSTSKISTPSKSLRSYATCAAKRHVVAAKKAWESVTSASSSSTNKSCLVSKSCKEGSIEGFALATCHTSHITHYKSTRHTSHVTRHTSHVTRHTSHVTRHTSQIILSHASPAALIRPSLSSVRQHRPWLFPLQQPGHERERGSIQYTDRCKSSSSTTQPPPRPSLLPASVPVWPSSTLQTFQT